MAGSFPCPKCTKEVNISAARDLNGARSVRCPHCYTEIPIRGKSDPSSVTRPIPAASSPGPVAPRVTVPSPITGPANTTLPKVPPPPPPAPPRIMVPAAKPLLQPAAHVPTTLPLAPDVTIAAKPVAVPVPLSGKVQRAGHYRVFGIAACGIMVLIIGGMGLSGFWSRPIRSSSIAEFEAKEIDRGLSTAPEKTGVDPKKISPTPKQVSPSNSDQNQPPTELPSIPPRPRPVNRGSGPLVSARLLSLDALFDRLQWMDRALGEKFGLSVALKKIRAVSSQQGVQGNKPCGAYFQMNDTETAGAFVILLPVSQNNLFRQMLAEEGFTESRRLGDLTELNVPVQPVSSPVQFPPKCYLRFANSHAYMCLAGDANLLNDNRLPSVEQVLGTSELKALFTATIHLDRLPSQFRDRLNNGRQELKQKITAVDAATAEYGAQFLDSLMEFSNDLLTGKHQLRLDVDLGPKDIAIDLKLIGEPGSPLAASLATLSQTPSRFGELDLKQAALGALLNVRLPEGLRKTLPAVIQSATAQTLAQIQNDPVDRANHERLFKALTPTFAAGELDAAVAMYSNGIGRPACVVGGLKIVDGRSLDRFFQETIKEPDQTALRSLFQLNAETIGAVQAHYIVNQARTAEFNAVFGDHPVYLAFGTDMVAYSAGEGGKSQLTQRLQDPSRASALAQVSMNLKQLHEQLMGKISFPGMEHSMEFLSDQDPGRMDLRLDASEGLLQLHFSVTPAVVRVALERLQESVRFAPQTRVN